MLLYPEKFASVSRIKYEVTFIFHYISFFINLLELESKLFPVSFGFLSIFILFCFVFSFLFTLNFMTVSCKLHKRFLSCE